MIGKLNTDTKNMQQRRKPKRDNNFFRNKIFLMIFVPVISVISVVALILIIKVILDNGMLAASAGGDNVYVLPIGERAVDNKAKVDKDPFTSGGTAALVLDGIIYNAGGTSAVIIRSADMSYVVSPDEEVGDTGWVVASVTADTVTIKKGDRKETLSLALDAAGLINPEE